MITMIEMLQERKGDKSKIIKYIKKVNFQQRVEIIQSLCLRMMAGCEMVIQRPGLD